MPAPANHKMQEPCCYFCGSSHARLCDIPERLQVKVAGNPGKITSRLLAASAEMIVLACFHFRIQRNFPGTTTTADGRKFMWQLQQWTTLQHRSSLALADGKLIII